MRTRVLLLAVVIMTTAIVLTNCSKQDQVTPPDSKGNTMLAIPANPGLANRIKEFRQKIDKLRRNPEQKNNETMSIEDARWNIETLINATYGFPDEVYGKTRHDSATLSLQVGIDDMVDVNEVAVTYSACINQVLSFYRNSGFTNKGFLFITLKSSQPENGTVALRLKVFTGELLPTLPLWTPFSYGENWKYGDLLGKCDGTFFNESDGAKQIETQINMRRPVIQVNPPNRIIYLYHGPDESLLVRWK